MIGIGSVSRRRHAAVAAFALTALLGAGPAVAQEFPVHPMALTFPGEGTTHDFVKAAPVSGGFVAAWNRVTDGKTSVLIRRFAPDGSQASDVTVVEDGALASSAVEGRPEVVNLGGDRIGVVWMGAGPKLKGAVYDATTGELGKPVTYISDGAIANAPHDLALLETGIVAMVTRQTTVEGVATILFRLDQKMKKSGRAHIFSLDSSGNTVTGRNDLTVVASRPHATRREVGVLIYRHPVDRTLRGKKFDLGGDPQGKTGFLIAPASGLPANDPRNEDFAVNATQLSDGTYAIAYSDFADAGFQSRRIRIERFKRASRNIGTIELDLGRRDDQTEPDLFPYGDGYGVAWSQTSQGSGLSTQRMRFSGSAVTGVNGFTPEIITEYYGAAGPSGIAGRGETSTVPLPNGDLLRLFSANGRIYGDRVPRPQGSSPDGLTGTVGPDLLLGGLRKDRILGEDGDDFIDGGDGADYVDAGPGDDVVVANNVTTEGPEVGTYGGPGADVFVINPGSAKIWDFETVDRLDVSRFNYATPEAALANVEQDGGNAVIHLRDQLGDAEAIVRLRNFKLKNLTAANIIN